MMEITDKQFENVVKFHGHICPGIAFGIKVSLCALEKLDPTAESKELTAIVENDACPVDAVQVMTGCTFGKGNLIFKNYGKQVYTFFDKKSDRGIRISFRNIQTPETVESKQIRDKFASGDRSVETLEAMGQAKAEKIHQIMNMPADELFEVTTVTPKIPDKFRLSPSVDCAVCKEKVMESQAKVKNGRIVCIPCYRDDVDYT